LYCIFIAKIVKILKFCYKFIYTFIVLGSEELMIYSEQKETKKN